MFIDKLDNNHKASHIECIHETPAAGQIHTVKQVTDFWDELDSEQWVVLDNDVKFLLRWYDGSFYEGQRVILTPKNEDTLILTREDNPHSILELYRVENKFYKVF